MRWFANFMLKRRGVDQLNIALLVSFLIVSFLFVFLPRELFFIRIIEYVPLAICIYRMFSKNLVKRQEENDKFIRWWSGITPKINKKINRIKDSKTHKFIKCPNCKQLLRLPRGRGRIRIVCPKCSNIFERRT